MHSTSEPFTVSASHERRPVDLVSRIVALLGWDLDELLTHDLNAHQGPRRKVQAWQLIVGMVAHCLPFTGRFSQCMSLNISACRFSIPP